MSSYGVLTTGFAKKPFDQIKTDIESRQLTDISAGLNHSATSLLSDLNAIYGDAAAEIWEVAQAAYSALDPNSASGAALDNLAQITGVTRFAASASTVDLEFTVNAAVVIPAGTAVSVPSAPDIRFLTDAVLVFAAAGTASVGATADATGPIDTGPNSITFLENPISQVTNVTNPARPDLGRNAETDEELRLRRADLLAAAGSGTLDAIRAAVALTLNVDQVTTFENDTHINNFYGNGLPPHSFEVIVRGGDDDDIAQSIWDNKGATARPFGFASDSGTASDTEGTTHTVAFTRPAVQNIYIDIDIVVDLNTYPGDAVVQQAVADYLLTLGIGDDVIVSKICIPVFAQAGVEDLVEVRIGTAPNPTSTSNLVIGARTVVDVNDPLTDIVITQL